MRRPPQLWLLALAAALAVSLPLPATLRLAARLPVTLPLTRAETVEDLLWVTVPVLEAEREAMLTVTLGLLERLAVLEGLRV
jgi:hypothetical protein